MLTGELGYTPHEFFNLLPRELNDIIEGFNNKIKRDNELVIYQTKVQRKAAFISILPHIKPGSITEQQFNREVWPVDEGKEEKEQIKLAEDKERERIKKMQEFVRQHQLKLSEEKRLKQSGK